MSRAMRDRRAATSALHEARESPTLLVISQVYAPDPAAVGQHITDVAEAMVIRGWRVIVYTASRGYDDTSQAYPRRELRNGVEVRRLPASSFGKRSILIRLLGGVFFLAQAVTAALLIRRATTVLVSTSPPFAHVAGLLLRTLRSMPFVWWVMDLNPDQLIAAGRLKPTSPLATLLDLANRLALHKAAAIIVLDRFMRARLMGKGSATQTLHTIRPWSHNRDESNGDLSHNQFRIDHGLEGRFVVMYSGNHAIQHPLETLLAAARRLDEDDSIRFVFVGSGAGKQLVEEAIHLGCRNILSLPFQPLRDLSTSLAAADMHAVSMADNVVGIVHPCKIYGALAAGCPILFFGPMQSHVGDLLSGARHGTVIAHGDVDQTIAAIRKFQSLTIAARTSIGQEARESLAMLDTHDRPLDSVCDVLCAIQQTASSQDMSDTVSPLPEISRDPD
jgi:colanic acid biosynthesis glycosyl transferase WcaI